MTSLRIHFDGRVFVPDGPIPADLPNGQEFELVWGGDRSATSETPIREHRFGERNGLPVILSSEGTKPITPEDVERAQEDY